MSKDIYLIIQIKNQQTTVSGIEILTMHGIHSFISETKKTLKSPSGMVERGYFKNPYFYWDSNQ